MSLPIYVVDAFTVNGKPFTGNSAGVCLLEYDDDISDDQKQEIAMEMNLSETAFVSFGWTKGNKLSTAAGADIVRRTLRWFTPTTEVPLCGHATVASAKIIYEVQLKPAGKRGNISFESKFRGKLGASVDNDGSISLNFPSNPSHSLNPKEHAWMGNMLQQIIGENCANAIQDVQYSPGTKILLIRLKDEVNSDGLRSVKPHFNAMLEIETDNFVRDVIVTVKGSGKIDFYSRFFAPWDGIDEDPVTGLTHRFGLWS